MNFINYNYHYSVGFKKEDGKLYSVHGDLGHVLKTIVNETSIDVETITLSGYNVVQPD